MLTFISIMLQLFALTVAMVVGFGVANDKHKGTDKDEAVKTFGVGLFFVFFLWAISIVLQIWSHVV